MSYDSAEISANSGKPIELFDFQFGSTHYRFTSGPVEVTYNFHDYAKETIQRGDLELTEDAFKNQLEIKINRDNTFARLFINAPLEGIVSLTIFRGHGSDFITFWIGVLARVTFEDDEIVILVTPKTTSMTRIGLRRKYQKLCNYDLYGIGCTVNKESFKVTSTITTVSGVTITDAVFATKPDGWFLGGKIVVGNAERLITSHVTTTITISKAIIGTVAGDAFIAFAGDDHTLETCRTKFDNLINYGGQPWIPNKNPFSGDAIA